MYIRPLKIERVVAGRSGDIAENREQMRMEILRRVEDKYFNKNGEFPRRTNARYLRTGEVGQMAKATMESISSSQDISCQAKLSPRVKIYSTDFCFWPGQSGARPMTIQSSDTRKCSSRSTGVLLRGYTPRMMPSWSLVMWSTRTVCWVPKLDGSISKTLIRFIHVYN
jgi:hypothetical protein